MSYPLTWPEARELALHGVPVRREAWGSRDGELVEGDIMVAAPSWIERRPGLWVLTNDHHATRRVVDAAWFTTEEIYAQDWTDDPLGTVRDHCVVDPPRPLFVPPGVGLSGEIGATMIELHCDLGASAPAGGFTLTFFLDGVFVGALPAGEAGRYTLAVPFSPAAYSTASRIRAWVDVTASLPLPEWTGHAEWELVLPAVAGYFRIDLVADFPMSYSVHSHGLYGAHTYGPYPDLRFVYSHAAEPAFFDDDLVLDGVLFETADDLANYVGGGATTLLRVLPAGATFTVDVRNGIGPCWAQNYLRLYNRPI